MKGIIKLFVFLIFTMKAFSQTETFDIVHYTPPKNWKQEKKPGVVILTHVDESKGAFCVLAIYASTASSGNPQQDFSTAWKDLSVGIYGAEPGPKTESQSTPEGWKVVAGAAPIVQDSVHSFLVLTVISGFGKKLCVLANFNDESYLNIVDTVLQNMTLDKKASVKNDKPIVNSTVAIGNGQDKNYNVESFGHLRFVPIKDWAMQRYSTAIIFKPSVLPEDRYIETRIMESRPFSGTLQQAFAESWNEALQQLKLISPYTPPYSIITEKKSFRGWEYIQGEGTVKRMDDPGYEKYYVNLFVIKLNNRIERIVTAGLQNINGADYSLYNSSIWRDPILGLVFSLQFDDWKEPVIGALKGQELSGMYEGLKLTGGALLGSYALFFPNGQVFFGEKFPADGFEGKNTWLYAEQNTRNWGTYTVQNGKGTINMGYGNIPLKVVGADLVITTQNTQHTYEKLPSLDGAVINGTYAFSGDWGGKPPSITFTSDGKFIDEGALNILNHQTTDPDEFNITVKPGNGIYEIKNYTLVFKYSDGRRVQFVFTGNGFDRKNPSPKSLTLSFNDDTLYKK